MEKKTSRRKIESNRKNALRSTGPKTTEGKQAVRYNALTHGILAKAVVIESGDWKEDRADFDALVSRLQEDLGPEGVLEQTLVEKIAIQIWRQARVYRAETGEIRKHIDSTMAPNEWSTGADYDGAVRWDGFGERIDILDQVRRDLEDQRRISPDSCYSISETFDIDENELMQLITSTCKIDGTDDEEPTGPSDKLDPEAQQRIIKLIDQEINSLNEQRASSQERKTIEREAKAAAAALPRGAEADRILRYETATDKALYRAIKELERLQRQRLNVLVSPPIPVELSAD